MSIPRKQLTASTPFPGAPVEAHVPGGLVLVTRRDERTCIPTGCLGHLGEPAHHPGQLFITYFPNQ